MKRIKSLVIFLLLLSMTIMLVNGCKKNETNSSNQDQNSSEIIDEENKADSSDSKSENNNVTGDDKPVLPETKELLIYGMNNESLESEQVSVSIPKDSEITPEYIVDLVVGVFEEDAMKIGIDSVTADDDQVIVSFQSDKAPLADVGSGVEITILDSISKSLLDNLSTCNKVIFQVEGAAYASGHVELEIDEVYKWK